MMSSWQDFLTRQQLDANYLTQAHHWFTPLVEKLVELCQQNKIAPVMGLHGCQGAGKTTLTVYLQVALAQRGLRAVTISLDDFYLSRAKRQARANQVHPLLATRGVPGTHDTEVAITTLKALQRKDNRETVKIPRFDKTQDDLYPQAQWSDVEAPVDIVLFEGWCLGTLPQKEGQLLQPVNDMERDGDAQGHWRNYVNNMLKTTYRKLFSHMDYWVMLKAPSFDVVYRWRLEQEQKLFATLSSQQRQQRTMMQGASLRDFLQHYQRLTEHALETLAPHMDWVYHLATDRQIVSVSVK